MPTARKRPGARRKPATPSSRPTKARPPVPRRTAQERLLKASGGQPPKGATARTRALIADAHLAKGHNIGIAAPPAKKRRERRILDEVDNPGKRRKPSRPRKRR